MATRLLFEDFLPEIEVAPVSSEIVARPYQVEAIDAAFVQWKTVASTLIVMPTGCHEYGHPILRYNGQVSEVQDIGVGLKVLKDHFQQAAYHTACAKCGGKGCKVCENTGWIPEYLKGTL